MSFMSQRHSDNRASVVFRISYQRKSQVNGKKLSCRNEFLMIPLMQFALGTTSPRKDKDKRESMAKVDLMRMKNPLIVQVCIYLKSKMAWNCKHLENEITKEIFLSSLSLSSDRFEFDISHISSALRSSSEHKSDGNEDWRGQQTFTSSKTFLVDPISDEIWQNKGSSTSNNIICAKREGEKRWSCQSKKEKMESKQKDNWNANKLRFESFDDSSTPP